MCVVVYGCLIEVLIGGMDISYFSFVFCLLGIELRFWLKEKVMVKLYGLLILENVVDFDCKWVKEYCLVFNWFIFIDLMEE